MVVLLAVNSAQAKVCQIVNGSFEDDAWISNIAVKDPNGWTANVPADKFRGYVSSDWRTDGSYNLTLYSEFWQTFAPGDMATASQQLYLADVNEIRFDLKLDTYAFSPWDPNKCTAVVLIDDEVAWESNTTRADVRGEYRDQAITIGEKYKAPGLHKLSLGIRVNVAEQLWDRYITHWDSIECTVYCGGGGLLPGDFNRDCYVDVNDLKLVAEIWLAEVDRYDRRNLFRGDDVEGYGTINFLDFAAYASIWDGNISDLSVFAQKWLAQVVLGDKHNLFRGDYMEGYATINFLDFAAYASIWDGNISDLSVFAQKWLAQVVLGDKHNLFRGDDIKPYGIVNFLDFGVLADNWLSSSYMEGQSQ
jgi:hypothetical protein